jgi:hypothetical protein
MKLKEKNPQLKILISCGGWGKAGEFDSLVGSDSARSHSFTSDATDDVPMLGNTVLGKRLATTSFDSVGRTASTASISIGSSHRPTIGNGSAC